MVKPLINEEFENLVWDIFPKVKLIRIRCIGDGNCLFHALAKAYFKPYITGKLGGEVFDRKSFIRNLRKDLAKTLGTKINPQDPLSKTYYASLSNGELENIAKEMPEYSLKNMQKELDSNEPVSNIYNEFISDQLNVDIYILDAEKKDVYMTGSDEKLLYKNRKSIVVLYMPGHFELIGVMKNQSHIETFFSPTDPFIRMIRKRMEQLKKK